MKKIPIGEYIRTNTGLIDKVTKYITEDDTFPYDAFEYIGEFVAYSKDEIVKHSKDIIDLVEVRDYVNGHLVLEKYQRPYDGQWQVDCGDVRYEDNDIKTILTHEMYEQNCYKVGVD